MCLRCSSYSQQAFDLLGNSITCGAIPLAVSLVALNTALLLLPVDHWRVLLSLSLLPEFFRFVFQCFDGLIILLFPYLLETEINFVFGFLIGNI